KQLNIKNSSLTMTVAEILQKIPDGKEAIVFFCGDRNTYVMLANKKGVKKVLKLAHTKAFEKETGNYLNTYFYNGPGEMINNPQGFYSASNKIYKQLFSQI